MDIVIAVALFLISARLAYLGVVLTMNPPETEREKRRYKITFVVLPILATALVCWQAVLNRSAQNYLQSQLAGIAGSIVDVAADVKTLKTTTTGTVPTAIKPSPSRSHIHITAVELVSANPGEVIQVRTHFENDGGAPITELRNYIAMAVFPFSDDTKTQTMIEDSLFKSAKDYSKDLPIVPNQVPAHSIILNSDNHGIQPLTPDLLEKIKRGEYAIYLTGTIAYKDSSALRHSDYCYWTKGDVRGMKLCFVHNQEP
jgi:hypothetical protein